MYCGFQILLNPFGDQILHHAIVSQKLQNTHTFVAKITIWISAHPNFVHFLGLLYISEKICTFHFLSQTGIGPLHCQSYARRSNMGKCHKLVLGLKFWSVYIFKSPLAATALSPFSISYLRKRDWQYHKVSHVPSLGLATLWGYAFLQTHRWHSEKWLLQPS